MVYGVWSPESQISHSNVLEMKAVFLTCQHFQDQLRDKVILVRTDNVVVLQYLNKLVQTFNAHVHPGETAAGIPVNPAPPMGRFPQATQDYFLAQMDQFKEIPRGVLAHATHVRGTGTYIKGIEKPRVEVILATAISKEKCEQINLGYLNPEEIRIEDYREREDQGILYVDHAGEILYRLEDG